MGESVQGKRIADRKAVGVCMARGTGWWSSKGVTLPFALKHTGELDTTRRPRGHVHGLGSRGGSSSRIALRKIRYGESEIIR